MDAQMKYLLANLRHYTESDVERIARLRRRDDRIRRMQMDDLIKIGLIAANELGVPADAQIVHVGRGDRVRMPYEVKRVSGMATKFGYDVVELQRHVDPNVMMGYAEHSNSLILRMTDRAVSS